MRNCYHCHKEYLAIKSFDYECPIYKEGIALGGDKEKCIWIDIVQEEPFESQKRLEELK